MNASIFWLECPDINDAEKRKILRVEIAKVLLRTDWTQLPYSGLSLLEQIEQQELRLAWMELDDPNLSPDSIELPPYPLMERL